MTIVLGGIGAAIGSLFPGGTYAGWMIGSAIGGMLDQPKPPDIGKLTDRKISGSAYGSDIAVVWGKGRVSANIIWAAEDANGNHLRQVKSSSGGKGGKGGGKVYKYYSTFAAIAAQGTLFLPDASQADGGDLVHRNPVLKRVWGDDLLIYEQGATKNLVTPAFYPGTESQSPDATIIAKMAVSSGDAPAYRGMVYLVFNDMALKKFGGRVPNISVEIHTDAVTVGNVFSDLARMTGLLASQLDVTAATEPVTGFVKSGLESPQASIAALLDAYAYDAVEVDGVIRLVKRGGASAGTVLAQDLGVGENNPSARIARTQRLTTELPGRVTTQFIDAGNSYQAGSETAIWPVNPVSNTQSLSYPLVLTSDEGRAIAARKLDAARTEIEDFEINLGPKYLKYAPGDILTVPTDTGSVRLRVLDMVMGANFSLRTKAILDSAAVISQTLPGGGGVTPPPNYQPAAVLFDAWSGKEVQGADQAAPGFYVVAAKDPTDDGDWQGGVVWYSLDAGVSWIEGPTISGIGTFGVSTSTLSASGAVADAFDNTNTVAVNIAPILGTLANATDAQIDAGENYALLGVELLAFGTATVGSPNNYTLSHIKRGLRGSTMSGHTSADRFVMLTDDIVRINVDESYIGSTVKVKVLGEDQVLGDVTAVDVVIAARTPTETESAVANTKPFVLLNAPVAIDSDVAGGVTTGWETKDLSANVPAGATLVRLRAKGVFNDAERLKIEVRKDTGETAWVMLETGGYEASTTKIEQYAVLDVPVKSDRSIQLQVTVPNGTPDWAIELLGGYWR